MLFNKAGKGNEEMKDLLGFISKVITFSNFNSYIPLGERDVYPLIGLDVQELAQNHYNSDKYNVSGQTDPAILLLDELVRKIQVPVALYAYLRYVPSNDLTHSDVGRQITVTEQEKPAFEWMIERDNQNLISLAYENMDLLLEFLNKNSEPYDAWATETHFESGDIVIYGVLYICRENHTSGIFADDLAAGKWMQVFVAHLTPEAWETGIDYLLEDYITENSKVYKCIEEHNSGTFADDLAAGKWEEWYNGSMLFFEWSGSVAYTKSQRLLISSAAVLNEYFNINNSSRLYYTLVPILSRIQRDMIVPCFSAEKFSEILLQISMRNITQENAGLIDTARLAISFLSMAAAVIQYQPQVFPEGIFNSYIDLGKSSKSAAGASDRTKLAAALQEIGRAKLENLQETIRKIASDNLGETFEPDDLLPQSDSDDKFLNL